MAGLSSAMMHEPSTSQGSLTIEGLRVPQAALTRPVGLMDA